jgi:hypothetical protein
MLMIVKGKIPKNIPNCTINTFEEEYTNYLRTAKKHWRTHEGFSLMFDSTLEDLKKSHFIYAEDQKLIEVIKKRLNVIE